MLKASSMSKQMKSIDDCGRSMSFMALKMAFSLDTSPMSQDAASLAERELRETPEQVQKSLAELRQLLKGTCFYQYNINTTEVLFWERLFEKARAKTIRFNICDLIVSSHQLIINIITAIDLLHFTLRFRSFLFLSRTYLITIDCRITRFRLVVILYITRVSQYII